jgi:hypothetical protein
MLCSKRVILTLKEAEAMLEKELKYFEDHKEELLKHYENQFVLIKDDQLIGAFTTEAEAYAAGIQKFGNQPFLIKRVTRDEEIVHFPALTLGLLNARS